MGPRRRSIAMSAGGEYGLVVTSGSGGGPTGELTANGGLWRRGDLDGAERPKATGGGDGIRAQD